MTCNGDGWPDVKWGKELVVKEICGSRSALSSASYIAKYATKSTESVGGLTRRINHAQINMVDVSEHVRRYLETAWQLGERAEFKHLNLHRWAHCLGFRGHWSTKSRHYSTTFKVLREERQRYARLKATNRVGRDG